MYVCVGAWVCVCVNIRGILISGCGKVVIGMYGDGKHTHVIFVYTHGVDGKKGGFPRKIGAEGNFLESRTLGARLNGRGNIQNVTDCRRCTSYERSFLSNSVL